jgi:hypothetical protein
MLRITMTSLIIGTATIDDGAAIELLKSWGMPILGILIVVTPVAAAISCAVAGLKWMLKSDEEKQGQQGPGGTIKKIVVWSIFIVSISTIFAIVGLVL